jgi:hypothetical protein
MWNSMEVCNALQKNSFSSIYKIRVRVVNYQKGSKTPMILLGYVRPGYECQRLVIVKPSG